MQHLVASQLSLNEYRGGKTSGDNGNGRFHQKIVLACPGEPVQWNTSDLGIGKVHGLNTDVTDGLPDYKRSADLFDWDTIEQHTHIFKGIDSN